MGTKANKNKEEMSNDIKEYIPEFNYISNNGKNNKLIFTSTKKDEIKDANESYNTNISITEELNKSTKIDSTYDTKSDLVKFTFKWIDTNNDPNKELEVMITGTFLDNWNLFMRMVKNPETKIYEYETFLPKQIHYFKYIVNNKWLCSDLYGTRIDNSHNINNYIDLTNYQSEILSNKDELREYVVCAESYLPDELLPYPTYDKLLFSLYLKAFLFE